MIKPPPLETITSYFLMHGSTELEANKFYCYYESVGWVVGRNKPMKRWTGCAGGWILRQRTFNNLKDDNRFSKDSITDRLSKW